MAESTKIVVSTSQAHSYLASPTIKVVVGVETETEPRSFFVHVQLIAARSRFFAKALKNYTPPEESSNTKSTPGVERLAVHWSEGAEGVVRLPVDKPEVFANYLQLLYTGLLPIEEDCKIPTPVVKYLREEEKKATLKKFSAAVGEKVHQIYDTLAELYVFSEKIQDLTSKKILLSAIFQATRKVREDSAARSIPDSAIHHIYLGTMKGDPLRAFVVDENVCNGHVGWLPDDYEDLPHEFLFEVVHALLKERETSKVMYKTRNKDAKYYQDKLEEVEKEGDSEEMATGPSVWTWWRAGGYNRL